MLEDLPVEVVEQVAGYVDISDILNIRRCSRQLCRKTWSAFGTAFFSSVPLDFCPEPLDRLQHIAYHETLRHFVRSLRVGAICRGCHNPPGHPLGRGHHWAREDSGCLDTMSSVISGFRSILVEKLVNCQAISVTDECGSYVEQEGTDRSLSTTDAVFLLLSAIAGLPIKSFRIDFRRMQPLMNPHQLPRSVVDSATLSDSWAASLKDLQLTWYLQRDDLFPVAIALVMKARALRSLQLDWSLSDVSSAFLQQLAEAPELPSLTHLRLDALRGLTPELLCRFLSLFKDSLKCLEVSFISFISGNWSAAFLEWAHTLTQLECVTVRHLSQTPGRGRWLFCPMLDWPGVPKEGKLEFMEGLRFKKYRVNAVRYMGKGEAMRSILEGLAETIYFEDYLRTARDAVEGNRLPDTVMIAGRLRAEKVKKFQPINVGSYMGF